MDMDVLDRLIHYALTSTTPDGAVEKPLIDANAESGAEAAPSRPAEPPDQSENGPADETVAHSNAEEETTMAKSKLSATPRYQSPQISEPSRECEKLISGYLACQQFREWRWDLEFRKSNNEIGRGGQGIVYSIEPMDPFFANRALKLFSPKSYDDATAYRQDMERMKSVASVVEQICHGNLIQVERFESRENCYYLVMRRIDGFDARYALQPMFVERLLDSVTDSAERWKDLNDVGFAPWGTGQRALKPGVAVYILENGLRGVSALHDKEIVHCDIKPANLMLTSEGTVRLIDIGSAYRIGHRPHHHWWTPRYAPPEVLEGGDWTPKSDLASAGYVLIEFLSGRPDVLIESRNGRSDSLGQSMGPESVTELDAPTRKALAAAKRQLPSRLEELIPYDIRRSNRLKELCINLIHPDPEKRFENARQAIFGQGGTHRFLRELVHAHLDAYWVSVMENWVKDMKSLSEAVETVRS
jgi:eukaryotic-like serine/threonine-protein kinase